MQGYFSLVSTTSRSMAGPAAASGQTGVFRTYGRKALTAVVKDPIAVPVYLRESTLDSPSLAT